MSEVWMPIPGYEGSYEASSLGRIRSLTRFVNHAPSSTSRGFKRVYVGRILSQYKTRNGYIAVRLSNGKSAKTVHVHRLICQAFLPMKAGLTVVNHKDGDKTNNRLDNLEWCTPSRNMQHAIDNGLKPVLRGSEVGGSVLNDSCVFKIRYMLECGETQRSIAEKFGIGQKTVSSLRSGKTWGHLPWPNRALARTKRQPARGSANGSG